VPVLHIFTHYQEPWPPHRVGRLWTTPQGLAGQASDEVDPADNQRRMQEVLGWGRPAKYKNDDAGYLRFLAKMLRWQTRLEEDGAGGGQDYQAGFGPVFYAGEASRPRTSAPAAAAGGKPPGAAGGSPRGYF
jgi:hypothetical protein